MSKMKLTDITKKVSAGLAIPLAIDAEKKAKAEAEEKRAQIAQVLSILEDVRLQASATHAGLLVAYHGRTLAPILNPGVKFSWYRMCGDEVEALEDYTKGWYAPTIEDIGHVLCLQCEDNFDQGCSRYLEVALPLNYSYGT
jgi:hypothetical protein